MAPWRAFVDYQQMLLHNVYFSIEFSQYIVNGIILFTLISNFLFERIFVNNMVLPLFANKSKNRKIEKISFWFNDWLYEVDIRQEKLDRKNMFIPFFQWKRYKYKHVREYFSRQEKNSKLKHILFTCFIWELITLSIILPLEIASVTFPLRIFTLLLCFFGPKLVWERCIANIVNTKFLLNEFRTPRIAIIFAILFYVFPLIILFGPDISHFLVQKVVPAITQTKRSWFNKGSRKLIKQIFRKYKFISGLYAFWVQFGFGYALTLAISAILDNLWSAFILTRVDPPGKTQLEELSTSLLDLYRIRTTDKLIALWPFIIVAVEIFGRWYFKVWSPALYSFVRELDYLDSYHYHYPQITMEIGKWDGILIRHHIENYSYIMNIIHWLKGVITHIVGPISDILKSMNAMFRYWPGCVPFGLSFLWRGIRFRGPDTYPNESDDVPELPNRRPFITINKNFTKKKYPKNRKKLLNEEKLIQSVPKCTWQKYFVRWNWCYAFTLSFLDAVCYRGIFKSLVGTANWKLITVSPSMMATIKSFVINAEATFWLYGVICCFLGCRASISVFPIFDTACKFHIGIFCELKDRFKLPEKTPLILYPYDVIELKKAVNREYPDKNITRKQKIQFFIKYQFLLFKKNIPKLLFILIIGTYISMTSYEYLQPLLDTK